MKKFLLIIIGILFSIFSNAQTWQEYSQNMVSLYQNGNLDEAIVQGEKAAHILKDDPNLIADYAGLLNNLAFMYLKTQRFDKSEAAYIEIMDIIVPVLTKEHKIYAGTANYLGEVYLETGKYAKAKQYLKESEAIRKRLIGISDPNYTHTLRNLKKLYLKLNIADSAIFYQEQICNNMKELFGENSLEYFYAKDEEAFLYSDLGKFSQAVLISEDNHDHVSDLKTIPDKDRFYFMRSLGLLYQKVNNYPAAVQMYESLKKESKKSFGKSLDYALYVNELGVLYLEYGFYPKSLENLEEAAEIRRSISGEIDDDYAYTLNNLGVLYFYAGDFNKAEEYYLQAKDIREKVNGKNNSFYAGSLNSLAALYFEEGNYEKAEEMYSEALHILDAADERNLPIYFTVLTNFGELYEAIDDNEKADKYYKLAYEAGERIMGRNSLDFAKLLTKIAGFFQAAGWYENAENLFKEVLEIQLNLTGKFHPDYALTLNNLGTLYLDMQRLNDAEEVLLETEMIRNELYGEDHYQYTVVLNNLASLYYEKGDVKKAEYYIMKSDENMLNYVRNTVSYMSETESEHFLKMNKILFNIYLSWYFMRKEEFPETAGYAFNNILARKSLILQSEKQSRRKILNEGDTSLIRKYEEFIRLKEEIGKAEMSGGISDKSKMNKMKSESERLEKELINGSSEFKDRSINNNITWKEVKTRLKKDEAAIEFVHFRYYDLHPTDSIYYCALLIRPGYKYPKMLYLFEENELNDLLDKSPYENDHHFIGHLYHKQNRNEFGYKPKNDTISNKLDSLIWYDLDAYLEGVETLYISPAGLLHRISFSALSDKQGTWLSDKYDLNIVFGTKDILTKDNITEEEFTTAVLYGGINYDTKIEEMRDLSLNIPKDETYEKKNVIINFLSKDIARGGSWFYLDGTFEEANSIKDQLKKKGVIVTSYVGENAVEETIKRYSGKFQSPDIIHIATHGFFFPDPDHSDEEFTGKETGIDVFRASDNPLYRSGLLFSGANHVWTDEKVPDDIEDGILTAYEVSNLNLDHTELVVLSACETGLGDIKGSEGVYGLQRAFKIAGTDYLIMSLWQVPDQQTVDLMNAFYKYKLEGSTIPEAFRKAQNEIKEKYLPFYWAAFVLVR